MGKQYKQLTAQDIEFIKQQKLFYLASASDKEVNLSPKGYDSIRVLDTQTVLFLNHPGSGNRTHRDAQNSGEFTLLFNAFEGKAKILRLFCKAEIVDKHSSAFDEYLKFFGAKQEFVRDFFKFHIYAVETSCGEAIPYMEYKGDREEIREWMQKLHTKDKLQEYQKKHFTPPDLSKLQ